MLSALKILRQSRGLSIRAAADSIGIPSGYMWEIENGKKPISAYRAQEIANFYDSTIEEIFLPTYFTVRDVAEK